MRSFFTEVNPQAVCNIYRLRGAHFLFVLLIHDEIALSVLIKMILFSPVELEQCNLPQWLFATIFYHDIQHQRHVELKNVQ